MMPTFPRSLSMSRMNQGRARCFLLLDSVTPVIASWSYLDDVGKQSLCLLYCAAPQAICLFSHATCILSIVEEHFVCEDESDDL